MEHPSLACGMANLFKLAKRRQWPELRQPPIQRSIVSNVIFAT
jgi:hypothetical protein